MDKLYSIKILLFKVILNKTCREAKDSENIFIFLTSLADKRLASSVRKEHYNLMKTNG